MDFADAFKAAGAPLRAPRTQWSALDPNGKFIAVTVWQHEWEQGCGGKAPRLGPAHAKGKLYFGNTPEDIEQWAAKREAAERGSPDTTHGWKLLKEHHQRAVAEALPVRIIMIQAKGAADGSSTAVVKDARYRDDWQAEMNYFDSATGAYEYAIWSRTPS